MISKTYVMESVSLVSEESVRRTIDYHDITWLGSWLWCSFCTWTRGKFTINYGTHTESWLYRCHWDEAKNWINYNLCSREVPRVSGGLGSGQKVLWPPLILSPIKWGCLTRRLPWFPFNLVLHFLGQEITPTINDSYTFLVLLLNKHNAQWFCIE